MYMCFQSFNYDISTKILMSKRFDHKTAFLDTHSKTQPDNHIYASKGIVRTRCQPKKSHLEKICLASQPMDSKITLLGECV